MTFGLKKFNEGFHWSMAFVTGALITIGLVNLYSAVYFWGEGGSIALFWSQLLWTAIGIVLMLFVTASDYRVFHRFAIPAYVVSCIFLVLPLVVGGAVRGTHGWLKLGPISLQPAEFAKVCYIFMAARYFADHPNLEGFTLVDLWKPALVMFLPCALIIAQGDMGSALFLILIFISMALFAKIKGRTLFLCAVIVMIAFAGIYTFGLKEYQRDRIFNFMHPEADVKGGGYHLVQSKIAVGSGRIFGKGYLRGNINKLRYLPERHTDFVFPVFAEEWGFAGSLVVLILYASLLLMGVDVAARARDRFGAFLSMGVVALLFWQIAVNLGGVLGLMPLTGVTLPLMSYGGSSMIAILLAVGLIFSVHIRRFRF